MPELTTVQRKVLVFIAAHITKHGGWAPTLREMCTHFRWASTYTPYCHLEALRKKGAIARGSRVARAISITPVGWRAIA